MEKIKNKTAHSFRTINYCGENVTETKWRLIAKLKSLILATIVVGFVNTSLSQEIIKTTYGDKAEINVISKSKINKQIITSNDSDIFISKSLKLPFNNVTEFTTISFRIESNIIFGEHSISIRYSEDGHFWNEWKELHLDYAHNKDNVSNSFVTTELEYIDKKYKYYQFSFDSKVFSSESIILHLFTPKVSVLDNQFNNRLPQSDINTQLTCSCSQPSYTNRSNWGCPTGSSSSWTPVNTTVTHLIIHHSAGSNSSSNWAATVLSIWNQHTNTNGWGDIGYNWLIDPNGVVYEGRATSGSSDPIGAHMCSNNSNKMGVCLLGDLTSQQPTSAARQSLLKILAWKSCQKNIDPLGSGSTSSYSGFMNNISGHRDGCSPAYTECPGNSFYPTLSTIRSDVNTYINNNCSGGSVCTDNFESNNSSSTATDVFANPLNSSNSSNYTIQGNIGYAGDQDWFKIKIAACGTLTLNLSSLPQNYNLELYGANGLSQFINGSYNSSTQNEQIVYTSMSATSTYVFAKIYPNNSNDFTTASCFNLQFLWSPTTCVSSCTAPSNVNISNTTQTSVLVSWTAPVGTSSTYLRYRALSSGSFTQVDVTGLTSYTIPNLTCGTNYEEYLISNCNSGGTQSTSTQSFSTSSCNNCTYSLSSNSANFPYSGGNGSFTINATAGNGCNWAVNTGSTSGCSLTNITSISNGTGPFTITYSVDFNPTNNPLTCTLTVTGNNGYTQDYVVNIAPNTTCDPTFSQSSVNLPNTSGGGSFTINSGSGCYWSVSNSGCDFINFSPSSGYGTTVVNYTYTANTNTTSRTCRISLQNNRSINLIQAGTQPPCTVPINLQSNPSQTSATVSWTNGTGTNYYKIRYKKSSDLNFLESVLPTSNSTSYQINGLTCNTSYDWYIYDSCSNGVIFVIPSTLPASFTTTACPTCTTTPSAPNSLTTGYPSSNTIGLSWAGSIVGFNNFDIERATSVSGPFTHLDYVAPPTSNYNDPNIVAGTTYYYRVRACCDNNCSAYSNISSATACVWRNRATSITMSNDTICLGNSVTLSAIGGNLGTGDVWTWYLNGGFSIGSGSPITFTPTTSGTYCVKPDGGCVNQPNVSVTCKDFTVTNCVVTCNSISNGSTSNITSNSATINWNKDLTVATNNLIIEYKPLTSSTWLSNTLANNAITTMLNSLGCSVNYQYRVIASCTNGAKDTVAGTFTTLTCPTNICDTLPRINQIPSTCDLYTANVVGATYQWLRNGTNVGTNSRFYTVSGGNAIYNVTISNSTGTQICTSNDFTFGCNITGVQNNILIDNYSIFPNPTKNSVFIQSKSNSNLKLSCQLIMKQDTLKM
jgi:hypothetical protein